MSLADEVGLAACLFLRIGSHQLSVHCGRCTRIGLFCHVGPRALFSLLYRSDSQSAEEQVRALRVEMDAVNLKMMSQETICPWLK